MEDDQENISHDYSLVNKHLDELSQREQSISKQLKSKQRKEEIKNGIRQAFEVAIILFSLGVFALLIAFAIRLVVYSPLS